MARILHLLTRENDALATEIISRQREEPDQQVETVDLTQERPDYSRLLEKIFETDSIAVW